MGRTLRWGLLQLCQSLVNGLYEKNVVGFEKELGAVKVIKDQIQYRSQSLLNLARGYFRALSEVVP